MSFINVRDLSLEFPILDPSSRFLKSRLVRSLGGRQHRQQHQLPKSIRALDSLTFDLAAGDRLGIMGRNGAGKTTLLRVLSRIYEPTGGTIHVRGALTSFLDLTAGFDIDATGHENIDLRGMLEGWDKEATSQARSYVEDISGLDHFLDLPLRTYSAGMLMRLAFAVATARPVDILLMDEWLSVGDSEYLRVVEARMKELIQSAEILVLASHSSFFIERWCTRLLILDAGRMSFIGSVPEGLAQLAK
jgi:lipopolysaccharide transport system ATP-binding protein